MSFTDNLNAARSFLKEATRLIKSTRQILTAMAQELRHSHWSSNQWQQGQLSNTLTHVEEVREGFVLSQQASPKLTVAELQFLVKRVLVDHSWWETLGVSLDPSGDLLPLKHQLIAYNHALIALAVVPKLPTRVITFPQPHPSYADLTAPIQPGDILSRIEEIERVIYQVAIMAVIIPQEHFSYHAFRRTYAFFEASDWLMSNYLRDLLDF